MEKYIEGLDMMQFEHLPQISLYNHNYHNGFGKDLLFSESDDFGRSNWYLVIDNEFKYLGETNVSDEKLHRYETEQT